MQSSRVEEPPARVRAALVFLNDLTMKTMNRVAATEHQIQEVDGQKLTEDEGSAQATACHLLSSYFAGTLKPDYWESKNERHAGNPGSVLRCFACADLREPMPECTLCNGAGRIVVYPAGES